MQIASTTRDGVTTVSPSGVIDTRAAQAFEGTFVQGFADGVRSFAVDFTKVDLITSAGIRVLVMMAHRLRGSGGVVLFGLSDRVRTVFEIGGLLQQFRIAGTEAQAREQLASRPAPTVSAAAAPARSRLSDLVVDLLGGDPLHRDRRTTAGTGEPSTLSTTVVSLLEFPAGTAPPEASD